MTHHIFSRDDLLKSPNCFIYKLRVWLLRGRRFAEKAREGWAVQIVDVHLGGGRDGERRTKKYKTIYKQAESDEKKKKKEFNENNNVDVNV